jgi:hypothetical protein
MTFRLGSLAYRPAPAHCTLLAGILLLLALVAGYLEAQRDAARLIALRNGGPAPVAVDVFDPALDLGQDGEVVLRAQIATDHPVSPIASDASQGVDSVVFPLLPVAAVAADDPVGLVIVSRMAPRDAALRPEQLLPLPVAQGPFGPIVEIAGRVLPSDAVTEETRQAAGIAGPADRALVLEAHPGGRRPGPAADRGSPVPAALLLAAGLALVAGLVLRRRVPQPSEDKMCATREAMRGAVKQAPRRPSTDKARSRFAPLVEQSDLSPPPPPPRPGLLQRLGSGGR